MASCAHTHRQALCFECFRAGMERTRARREAWAQRALPFQAPEHTDHQLSAEAIAHRRRMLAYLEAVARRA